MTSTDKIIVAGRREVDELLNDNPSIDFREFTALSDRFLHEYKELVSEGLPAQTITMAMLGATLNMHSLFGANERLPQVLRDLADMIDANRNLH